MDKKEYKANECSSLVYMMESSQQATFQLYNGRIFNEYYVEKHRSSDILGFKGNTWMICIINAHIFFKPFYHLLTRLLETKNLDFQTRKLAQEEMKKKQKHGMIIASVWFDNFK